MRDVRGLLQRPLCPKPFDCGPCALCNLKNHSTLVVTPAPGSGIIQVKQCDHLAVLGNWHVDEGARAEGFKGFSAITGPGVGLGVLEDDDLTTFQVVDVRAVVAKLQCACQALDSRGVPIPIDRDGVFFEVDRSIAGTANFKVASK